MKYQVSFSPTAKEGLESIGNYILEEFGFAARTKFLEKVEDSIELLSSFPKSCIESSKVAGLRKAVVTRYTIMLFRIEGERVEIAAVFDGRTNH